MSASPCPPRSTVRSGARLVLALALALAGLATPASAAEPVKLPAGEPLRQADKSFALGLWLYADGDLAGALAEFRRAYAAFPNFKVLYNIAALSHELDDWAGAIRTYRKYLDRGGDLVPDDRRAQVERRLVELGQKVGRIEVEAGAGKTEITVDEQPFVLTAPEQAVEVNPGRHLIRIHSPNALARPRSIEIASGERLRLVFEPAPAAAKPTVPVARPASLPVPSPAGPVPR